MEVMWSLISILLQRHFEPLRCCREHPQVSILQHMKKVFLYKYLRKMFLCCVDFPGTSSLIALLMQCSCTRLTLTGVSAGALSGRVMSKASVMGLYTD